QRDFLEKALKYYEGFAREKGDDPAIRLEAAKAYGRVSNLHRLLGDFEAAEKANRAVFPICERLMAQDPGRVAYRENLAAAWGNLGVLLEQLNRLPEAEAAQRQALALYQQLAVELPDRPVARELGVTLQALGVLRRRQGDLQEAERIGREAIAQQQ